MGCCYDLALTGTSRAIVSPIADTTRQQFDDFAVVFG